MFYNISSLASIGAGNSNIEVPSKSVNESFNDNLVIADMSANSYIDEHIKL